MNWLLITGILLVAIFLPLKEACGGRGVCRTGPRDAGNGKIESCIFYEIKPAALVLLDNADIRIPFYYSRVDECS